MCGRVKYMSFLLALASRSSDYSFNIFYFLLRPGTYILGVNTARPCLGLGHVTCFSNYKL